MSLFAKHNDRVAQLAETQIFGRLSRRRLRKLARLCVEQSFQRGERLIKQGGTGLGMFVITSGSVEVFRGEGAGRELLANLGPGDLLGEVALVDELPRSASAKALERTECLLITREAFRGLTRRDPEIAWCVVPTLTSRLRAAQNSVRAAISAETQEFAVLRGVVAPSQAASSASKRRWAEWFVRGLRRQTELAASGARGLGAAARWSEDLLEGIESELERRESVAASGASDQLVVGLAAASRRLVVAGFKLPTRIVQAAHAADRRSGSARGGGDR